MTLATTKSFIIVSHIIWYSHLTAGGIMDTMNDEQVTQEMEQSTNITSVNQETNVSASKGGGRAR